MGVSCNYSLKPINWVNGHHLVCYHVQQLVQDVFFARSPNLKSKKRTQSLICCFQWFQVPWFQNQPLSRGGSVVCWTIILKPFVDPIWRCWPLSSSSFPPNWPGCPNGWPNLKPPEIPLTADRGWDDWQDELFVVYIVYQCLSCLKSFDFHLTGLSFDFRGHLLEQKSMGGVWMHDQCFNCKGVSNGPKKYHWTCSLLRKWAEPPSRHTYRTWSVNPRKSNVECADGVNFVHGLTV